MKPADRGMLKATVLTAAMIVLISFAVAARADLFTVIVLATAVCSTVFFFAVFPGSSFFSIAFANFLAVYTCIFIVFVESNFATVTQLATRIAYVLPIFGFMAGTWWRRRTIRDIVVSHRLREGRKFRSWLHWLLPLMGIGVATFFVPGQALTPEVESYVLLTAMTVVSCIVFVVSSSISVFLLDTGLVFEAFFKRVQGLFIPAFAFCTFYSINVIVFACVYRILERFSAAQHFLIGGESRDITFQESLYFSIITLSTVGYGDIVPVSSAIRALASVQIVLGVLLLLFGFSEIMSYSRERNDGRRGDNDVR